VSVEVDGFRFKVGDFDTGAKQAAPPGASISDGSGSILLTAAMGIVVLSAPTAFSVQGSAAGSILTYWWL